MRRKLSPLVAWLCVLLLFNAIGVVAAMRWNLAWMHGLKATKPIDADDAEHLKHLIASSHESFLKSLLALALWCIGMTIGVILVLRRQRQIRAAELARRGLCPACGYDLRATPARCPECGTAVAGLGAGG